MIAQPRQPVFNIPGTVLLLIAGLAAVQGLRDWLPDAMDAAILKHLAFVPGRVTAAFDPGAVLARLSDVAQNEGADAAEAGRYFLGTGRVQPWTALTYSVLHGGWTHLGLNAVWLLAFGTPVARRLRAWRFGLLYTLAAVAGAATHYAVDPLSLQPLVGASAAVSAFMGAAMRFAFQPAPGLRPGEDLSVVPRLPLSAIVTDRRIAAFVAVWFVSNLVTGVAAVPLGLSDMPIAWQAHVGGFVFGLLAFPLLDPWRRKTPESHPGHGEAPDSDPARGEAPNDGSGSDQERPASQPEA